MRFPDFRDVSVILNRSIMVDNVVVVDCTEKKIRVSKSVFEQP